MDSEFDDIRPYRDHEVSGILQRLSGSPEFITWFQMMTGKKISAADAGEAEAAVKVIRGMLSEIKTVKDFQDKVIISMVLDPVVKNSIDELTSTGIERISRDATYLFISNHRDITLDPALVNYILFNNGFGTIEIAFGDNLLINEFISDMIRINKSFIVKRDLPIMEQLKQSTHLSKYIFHTLSLGNSAWIAQREGRAKDGNDATNPAIIKMLTLSQRDGGMAFSDFIRRLNIVPVAISYEFDPCDRLKAMELYKKKIKAPHEKTKNDDLMSMNLGLTGHKGRVHCSFSPPLQQDFGTEKEVAAAIDRAIISTYRLWPSNYIAYDTVTGSGKYRGEYTQEEAEKFIGMYARLHADVRQIIMDGYANPVRNREKLG